MKRIAYISPVDYVRGNISGRQDIAYNGAPAYDITTGEKVSAEGYQSRLVAQVRNMYTPFQIRTFQVRTRTTVNMTATMRHNLALMGGVGAIFSSLLRQKSSEIYVAIHAACPKKTSLRQFVTPLLRAGLAAKSATITIADGVAIVNPWISSDTPNVPVSAEILAKFASELSN